LALKDFLPIRTGWRKYPVYFGRDDHDENPAISLSAMPTRRLALLIALVLYSKGMENIRAFRNAINPFYKLFLKKILKEIHSDSSTSFFNQ
jgi:hypothetical protein